MDFPAHSSYQRFHCLFYLSPFLTYTLSYSNNNHPGIVIPSGHLAYPLFFLGSRHPPPHPRHRRQVGLTVNTTLAGAQARAPSAALFSRRSTSFGRDRRCPRFLLSRRSPPPPPPLFSSNSDQPGIARPPYRPVRSPTRVYPPGNDAPLRVYGTVSKRSPIGEYFRIPGPMNTTSCARMHDSSFPAAASGTVPQC